jgi:hypothetical protein
MGDERRAWFPHLDFAGEPMKQGEFREPFPMPEELARTDPRPAPVADEIQVEQDEGEIAAAARRIASWAEGAARVHVYQRAKLELAALATRSDPSDELVEMLHEARLQLEYLDGRLPTGTTPAVLARINAALSKAGHGCGGRDGR